METLRTALAAAGMERVATYIQSGNLVLRARGDEGSVAEAVDRVFTAAFGFQSRPTVRTASRWRALIDLNPFPGAAGDGTRLHAVLLDGQPPPEAFERLRALATSEELAAGEGVLYLHTPDGLGQSKVAEAIDRVLRVPATTRNWNTVLKLREMAAAALL
jgi:uncharacterized protein (DUF1697 family)